MLLIYGGLNVIDTTQKVDRRSLRWEEKENKCSEKGAGRAAESTPVNVIIMLLQTSADGNTTTSVLSFIATKADAGRHLSCQAENRIMGTAPIEDGWILQIQCKLINGDGSCVLSLRKLRARARCFFLIYSDESGRFWRFIESRDSQTRRRRRSSSAHHWSPTIYARARMYISTASYRPNRRFIKWNGGIRWVRI